MAGYHLSCPRCYITLKLYLIDVRLTKTTATIATEIFTELLMESESDQRAESKNLLYLSIYTEWSILKKKIKLKNISFVCSKIHVCKICISKLEQSTGDQTAADISVNTTFKRSSQRKKVILSPGLEKFLAKAKTMLDPQITKLPSIAYGNYSATILLL